MINVSLSFTNKLKSFKFNSKNNEFIMDNFLDKNIPNEGDFLNFLSILAIINGCKQSDYFVLFNTLENLCEYKPIIKNVKDYRVGFEKIYLFNYNLSKNELKEYMNNLYRDNPSFGLIASHILSCFYNDTANIYIKTTNTFKDADILKRNIRETLSSLFEAIPFARVCIDSTYDDGLRETGLTQCNVYINLPKTSNNFLNSLINNISEFYPEVSFETYRIERDIRNVKYN